MRKIVALKRILYDALGHFNDDDGWSMASHLAITALMALFPFLIFATTLASFVGEAKTEVACLQRHQARAQRQRGTFIQRGQRAGRTN